MRMHITLRKSECGWWTALVPASVLGEHAVVMQEAAIAGSWLEGTWDLSVLFPTTACDSTVVSRS